MITSRISTYQYYQDGLNGILKNQSAMYAAMNEITTGKKNNMPIYDKVQVERANVQISRQAQYLRNNDNLNHYLNLQENSLDSAMEMNQSIRETVLKLKNPTLSNDQKAMLKEELGSLQEQMISFLNTKDENHQYIFGGFDGNNKSFKSDGEYIGNGSSRQILLDDSENTFFSLDMTNFQGQDIQKMFTELNNYVNGTSTDIDIGKIDDSINLLNLSRTRIGLQMNKADNIKGNIEDKQFNLEAKISNLEDADITKSIADLNSAKAAYEASLKVMTVMNSTNLFAYM